MMCLSFKHSGKLGDIIYGLQRIRQFTKALLFLNGRSVDLPPNIIQSLLPLLQAQSYIQLADAWFGEAIDFDVDRFRLQAPWDENLADRHAKAVGLPVGGLNEPWLSVHEFIGGCG